jgi:hypothetical protein
MAGQVEYFVDEAGDHTLFDGDGNVIIGKDKSCSRFFILGMLFPDNPNELSRQLVQLRQTLREDPYFKRVPSMQPGEHKTYDVLHAKDDVHEVRYEVFKLLRSYPKLRFMACVKDKFDVLDWVRREKLKDPSFRYSSNVLYDHTVKRLFRDHLAKADMYRVHFSRRGSSNRTEQLQQVLSNAQNAYKERYKKETSSAVEAVPMYPKQHACLQAVDYFLWGLHQLFAEGNFRYVEYLQEHYRLVIDIDDHRKSPKGEYYNDSSNPITLEKVQGRLKK